MSRPGTPAPPRPATERGLRLLAGTSAVLAAGAALNLRWLPRVPRSASCTEPVAVCIPARDEEARLPGLLGDLAAQTGCAQLHVLVYDDDSSDATAAVAARHGAQVIAGGAVAPGWLGKPHACQQLARAAPPQCRVLVFLDADVRLLPDAIAGTVALLRARRAAFLSPYPRQEAVTGWERLVQPLLQWSWLTFLPQPLAHRSRFPSLVAANGQLLAVDRAAYTEAGGHLPDAVLDDIALGRRMRTSGRRSGSPLAGRGGMVEGSAVASCRMYESGADLRAGYRKSLWAAGGGDGSPAGSLAQAGLLGALYLAPAVAAVAGRGRVRATGIAGYAAGVAGRVITGRATGARVWPDALAHPVSVAALLALTAGSWAGRGHHRWKGRELPAGHRPGAAAPLGRPALGAGTPR